jgi:hypothetical protein
MKMDSYEMNLPYEDMRETAIRALVDVNAEISKLITLRDTWANCITWNEIKIKERDEQRKL